MLENRSWLTGVLLVTVAVLAAVFSLASHFTHVSREVALASTVVLALIAVISVSVRILTRPDHMRALQARQVLTIAEESLAHLRRGLDKETAQEVCRIALEQSEAAAVAITDTTRVLGFAGLGEDHHAVGGPILTRATHEAITLNEHRVLGTREEIGCPRRDCALRAAIVVPLTSRGGVVGTLKFYYTTPRLLNETQIAMVSGLARLLSTQVDLAELERQTDLAAEMELKALQAQINPHFLFNTINTIAMLIRTDPGTARELLREFASFYRRMLEDNDGLVRLERELDYALSYLRFEEARFGERLRVVFDFDEEALDIPVPAFIIQPLVENSVQHGIKADGPLSIGISAQREGDTVRVLVTDDGVGISAAHIERVMEQGFGTGLGIALKNVDDRLKGHFAPGSGLTIESAPGEGTTVTVTIVEPPASETDGR